MFAQAKSVTRIILSTLAFLAVVSFLLWQIAQWVLGAATSPDQYAQAQKKIGPMFSWLASQPWWVSALLLIGLLATAVWLMVSGVQGLVQAQKLQLEMPQGYMTAEQARQVLDWAQWFRHDWTGKKTEIEASLERLNAAADSLNGLEDRLFQNIPDEMAKRISDKFYKPIFDEYTYRNKAMYQEEMKNLTDKVEEYKQKIEGPLNWWNALNSELSQTLQTELEKVRENDRPQG